MKEGTLIVVVTRAANLNNKRSVSKQNPFCAVRIQNLVQKTKTIVRGGQNPAWDFEARFQLQGDLDSRFLKISVFDQNGSNVDLIGDCSVELAPAFEASVQEGYDSWHTITFGGKKTGEVYLEVTYYPKNRRQSRASQSLAASQASHRNNTLSPSASMSSLSSIGSMGSRRPLPTLPGQVSASSPSLAQTHISRSPSPLRQSYNSARMTHSQSELDTSTSLPVLPTHGASSLNGSRHSHHHQHSAYDLANSSMPDLRPSMCGSRPLSPFRNTQEMHTNLNPVPTQLESAKSLGDRYSMDSNRASHYYEDYNEGSNDSDLDIPEPPQHGNSANDSFGFDISSSNFNPNSERPASIIEYEAKEKKNVSHINAWYGKAMFQRFRK